MDGKAAVTFLIFQTAGSNATAVNEQITNLLNELEQDLPKGTSFMTMMSSNDFLFASIYNVVETLIVAIIRDLGGLLLLAGFQEYVNSLYLDHLCHWSEPSLAWLRQDLVSTS